MSVSELDHPDDLDFSLSSIEDGNEENVEPNAETPKHKRRKRVPTTERESSVGPVVLYGGVNKSTKDVYVRKVKTGAFVPQYVRNSTNRQESRLNEQRGFAKKLHDLKIKTGDEGVVIIRDSDGGDTFTVSTTPDIAEFQRLKR